MLPNASGHDYRFVVTKHPLDDLGIPYGATAPARRFQCQHRAQPRQRRIVTHERPAGSPCHTPAPPMRCVAARVGKGAKRRAHALSSALTCRYIAVSPRRGRRRQLALHACAGRSIKVRHIGRLRDRGEDSRERSGLFGERSRGHGASRLCPPLLSFNEKIWCNSRPAATTDSVDHCSRRSLSRSRGRLRPRAAGHRARSFARAPFAPWSGRASPAG